MSSGSIRDTIMSENTMKDIDHRSPYADELTSVWQRGDEDDRENDGKAAEPDEQIVPAPAD